MSKQTTTSAMNQRDQLALLLAQYPQLQLAILVGSRTRDQATPDSDWDIAIRWERSLDDATQLRHTEALRQQIATQLGTAPDKVDLIDITSARLAMRALIAEEGVILKGQESLAWSHFLVNTWAEIEEFHWRKSHAA